MQGIGDVLTMKDPARHVAFREYRDLFRQLNLLESLHQLQVRRAMWLGQSVELADHQRRDNGAIFRQLMLPPADRQVATKGLAIIEIGADDGRFQISTRLHEKVIVDPESR